MSSRHWKTLKRYDTRFDRILRAESLYPFFFADQTALARQTLQRLRAGDGEPCMSTMAQIVRILRQLTGKPYRAMHVFDVGETLAESDPLVVWLRRST